ncbi:DNA polymerase III subunit gamma/tau [Alteromonas sp. ASW11-36]|uniref:DNA polymerase III subunit gamma/tau n=1 Tax=Alteromonas arenosi TaxID=3055817 RepID=A0ABT7SVM3_9ALTE|nr:DNA polymerase III subunit gamma/tau [Alteromonas sp. ASW11-36]MDM7860248.1 DNA polymerase III subunit gamma/tau [Alteromonas sp. ASW11-36]
MSYQVLARKWRPRKFSELVGQEHVVAAISNALDNNRLHHAYLFTGTRGVGKTTIARIFAKSLNCETGQSANPCGKCGTCLDIEQGRFVDLLEIDAASRTKVEDTRELLDNVQYRPTKGDYKVYLIDEVHMLSKHSFNALLKTLEEPPPHVKFLLATTDPQKLPITILSRCLQFNLKALSREQISQQLAHVLGAENLNFEMPALNLIARAAQGSMRDALSLTDQAIAQGDNQVTQSVVTDMLGLLDRNHILRLAQSLATKQNQQVLDIVAELATQAPDFAQVLNELNATLHQIALTQIVPDACRLETTHAKAIYQLAKTFTPEHVQLLYQMGVEGLRTLNYAPDPQSGVEMVLMRMLAFSPSAELANVERIIQNPPAQNSSEPRVLTREPESVSDSVDTHPEHIHPGEQSNSEFNASSDTSDIDVAAHDDLIGQQHAIEQQAEQMRQSAEVARHDSMAQANEPVMQSEPIQPEPTVPKEPSQDDANLARTKAMLEMQQRMMRGLEQEAPDNSKKCEPEVEPTPEASVDFSANMLEEQAPQVDSEEEKQMACVPQEHVEDVVEPQSAAADVVEDVVNDPTEQETVAANEDIQPFLSNGDKLTSAGQIDRWSATISDLDVAGLVKQIAIHSSFVQQGDSVTLTLDNEQQHLLSDSAKNQLAQALRTRLNAPIVLSINVGEPERTPFTIQKSIDQMRHQYACEIVDSDPAIEQLLSAFNGTVLSDSIEPQ